MIDVTFKFKTECQKGQDPDRWSTTLAKYHQFLWSKRLDSGEELKLELQKDNSFHVRHGRYLFVLTSDCMNNSYTHTKLWEKLSRLLQQDGENPTDMQASFDTYGESIGNYIVFPKKIYENGIWLNRRPEGKKRGQTINQYRGVNCHIGDRFDITLECIRRFYEDRSQEAINQNPLGWVLKNFEEYFDLFGSFDGFVRFFLLEDFLEAGSVKQFIAFDENFKRAGKPQKAKEYKQYANACQEVNRLRAERIQRYVEEHGELDA